MAYSDEFAGFAADALNPDLSDEERAEALKAAIHACMDEAEESDDGPSSEKPGGLALVFGGGSKKKKA